MLKHMMLHLPIRALSILLASFWIMDAVRPSIYSWMQRNGFDSTFDLLLLVGQIAPFVFVGIEALFVRLGTLRSSSVLIEFAFAVASLLVFIAMVVYTVPFTKGVVV